MIETHSHLNIEDFDQDLDEVIRRAEVAGVQAIIVVGMDAASSIKAIEIAEKYKCVYATVGLHPGYVDEGDTTHIQSLLKHPKVVGIGECGTDLYWSQENIEKQRTAFRYQVELAVQTGLPLVIHTRNSFQEAYDVITPYKGKVKGVFHCFSSSLQDAKRAIDLGFLIGIDGPITYKNAGQLIEIVQAIDLKHLLIETDSPYLSPVPKRAKRNEPSHLVYIVSKISEIKGVSEKEVIEQTTQNAKQLFKLGGNNA